jgi:hypothetical protein
MFLKFLTGIYKRNTNLKTLLFEPVSELSGKISISNPGWNWFHFYSSRKQIFFDRRKIRISLKSSLQMFLWSRSKYLCFSEFESSSLFFVSCSHLFFTAWVFACFIKHCFICRPPDFNVSEDAGIESQECCEFCHDSQMLFSLNWTSSTNPTRSHPHSARSHPHLVRSHSQNQLDLVYTQLDLILSVIHAQIDFILTHPDLVLDQLYIHLIRTQLDLIHTFILAQIYLIYPQLDLIHPQLDLIHFNIYTFHIYITMQL